MVRGCVGGALCHFVVEQGVYSGAFEEEIRWCACAVRRLDTACWFMLGCVAFIAFSHTACADECTVRLSCVLNTALDLAAAALCIEWRMGES